MKTRTPSDWINKDKLHEQQNGIEKNLYNWLVLPNNLTETIKKTGTQFSLTLLSQSFDTPYSDEKNIFKNYSVDASYALVRKVFLNGDEKPIVFARVIIPEQTYLNYEDQFKKLGSAAIGNAILYADKQIERKDFEYKLIERTDPVFQELKDLNQIQDRSYYWARRSIFKLPKGPLLISEVFLNRLPDYPQS